MVFGAMLVGGMIGGSIARNRYESMAMAQDQEEKLRQAQAQTQQAEQAAQAARLQAAQAQARGSSEDKDDALHKLEKLGSLKKQGLITDEEFQNMKSKLISSM